MIQVDKSGMIVSVFVEGYGRYYGWGKNEEQAKDELIAGLTKLAGETRRFELEAKNKLTKFASKIDKLVGDLE